MDIKLSEVPTKEIFLGYQGKLIHTEQMSIAFWDVEQGATVPEHSHMNEQVMEVLEGEFELTVDGVTKVYKPGTLVVIPSYAKHGGKALTSCKLMDIFSPAREEYK